MFINFNEFRKMIETPLPGQSAYLVAGAPEITDQDALEYCAQNPYTTGEPRLLVMT